MGMSSAVSWWEESQLRVLVLTSLGVQYLLAAFGGARKLRIPPWCRFLIWLSFLGSDAMAIYALATLFNRRQSGRQQHDRVLEVFWAPVLLIHLGGQLIITAYNVEDNELWRRHIVTSLSQVTVAIYVFCKSWSWSDDRRLLAAAVLLFISGIIKCLQKPLFLKVSSFNSLAMVSDKPGRATTSSREEELEAYVQQAKVGIRAQATVVVTAGLVIQQIDYPREIFIDSSCPYSQRLAKLVYFWNCDHKQAYGKLKKGLSNMFNILYTRDTDDSGDTFTPYDWCYLMMLVLQIAPSVVATGLFHRSGKEAYRGDDVIVTFVLLYGSVLLELMSFCTMVATLSSWPAMVAQHNLIGLSAHNKRHAGLMSLARSLQCKDLLDQYWFMESCDSSKDITELVRGYVREWWIRYIRDAESYRMCNDLRGQWTLELKMCNDLLGWSLEKPFDESVLLWHMATDFYLYSKATSPDDRRAHRCREMSNYMMHLLFANTEMLMVGSRRSLFTAAYEELEDALKDEESLIKNEQEIALKVLGKVRSGQVSEDSFIHDAGRIADELLNLDDDTKAWEVIQGVWVEMLCYSAGRCRGYLHAKSLGSGGEFLTVISLFLYYLGMETFGEKLQRAHKFQLSEETMKHRRSGGEDGAAGAASCAPPPATELPKEEEEGAERVEMKQGAAAPDPSACDQAMDPSVSRGAITEIVVSP